jgi:segregation and condensation protein A
MTYKVKLEVFEGPLDLLLYLIKKNQLDIHDIPIAVVTQQYLEYLNLMQLLDLDIAGEFIVMAATLIHIKSKMLLPPEARPPEEEEPDPREELVRRLIEYQRYKEVAERLKSLEAKRFEMFGRSKDIDFGDFLPEEEAGFEVSIFDLISAFTKILKEVPKEKFTEIVKDEFTVEEKIHSILHLLVQQPVIRFTALFQEAKSKLEIIATFLALLELIRMKEVIIKQSGVFGEIEIFPNKTLVKPASPQTT